MSADIGRFNPATWHEHGVVRTPTAAVQATVRRRVKTAALAASVAFSLSAAWAMPAPVTLVLGAAFTAAAVPFPARMREDTPSDTSSDRIDPSEWGRLITLFGRLPRDERPEPDDPEPFI